jgi:4-hydroxy-2-oxoheptanedioate aldolase
MPGSMSAEIFSRSGADYVCIDYQHGLVTHTDAIQAMQAISAGSAAAAARVAANEPHLIASALDAGATTIIVPMVNTPDEALRAARSCHYPPRGHRSFGPARARLVQGTSDPEILDQMECLVMIETAEGLRNLTAILATPGVDGVFIGPSDLAISLGLKPHAAPYERPLAEAVDEILRSCKEHEKLVGIAAPDGISAAEFIAAGFDFIGISSDLAMLSAAAILAIGQARGDVAGGSGARATSTY